jgi:hypothetical protein
MFLGMCGVTNQLVQDFVLDPQKQVVIYPVYAPYTSSGTPPDVRELYVGFAAAEYKAFVIDLLTGKNVAHALTALNNQTQIDIANNDPKVKQLPDGTIVDNSDPRFNQPGGTIVHLV